MAETEHDEKVSAGYRALGGDVPPRVLDEAILAASRRSPTRWRVPLSVAAVLVLAVGVTLRMLPQRPEGESVALAPQVMETPRPAASAPAAAPAREEARPTARAEAAEQRAMRADIGAKPAETAAALDSVAADAARSAPPPAVAGAVAESRLSAAVAKIAQSPLTPEVWLERIAELRKQNRKREADESLAEFKKRYPDYRIPEALR